MQLARIVFAGALLFGVGCVPSIDGAEVADKNEGSNYAIDETITMEGRTLQEACTLDIARLT